MIEDLENMDEGMNTLAFTKDDIWQDKLVWNMCKAIRDILVKELKSNDKQ